uniref:Ogr/Delta-like zinc finger protein n=1 Tax=Myoviridae sp. ctRRy11 TaxID=2826651 RepID=A0A8S5MXW6_9CAUD|nr:MAG TPA: Ogr/Delta-like zinc finger protein [Myoviridae sp. ctRRy11]
MICNKCKTEMSVKKADKKSVTFICRNPKCSDYQREHTKSR